MLTEAFNFKADGIGGSIVHNLSMVPSPLVRNASKCLQAAGVTLCLQIYPDLGLATLNTDRSEVLLRVRVCNAPPKWYFCDRWKLLVGAHKL